MRLPTIYPPGVKKLYAQLGMIIFTVLFANGGVAIQLAQLPAAPCRPREFLRVQDLLSVHTGSEDLCGILRRSAFGLLLLSAAFLHR